MSDITDPEDFPDDPMTTNRPLIGFQPNNYRAINQVDQPNSAEPNSGKSATGANGLKGSNQDMIQTD